MDENHAVHAYLRGVCLDVACLCWERPKEVFVVGLVKLSSCWRGFEAMFTMVVLLNRLSVCGQVRLKQSRHVEVAKPLEGFEGDVHACLFVEEGHLGLWPTTFVYGILQDTLLLLMIL